MNRFKLYKMYSVQIDFEIIMFIKLLITSCLNSITNNEKKTMSNHFHESC